MQLLLFPIPGWLINVGIGVGIVLLLIVGGVVGLLWLAFRVSSLELQKNVERYPVKEEIPQEVIDEMKERLVASHVSPEDADYCLKIMVRRSRCAAHLREDVWSIIEQRNRSIEQFKQDQEYRLQDLKKAEMRRREKAKK